MTTAGQTYIHYKYANYYGDMGIGSDDIDSFYGAKGEIGSNYEEFTSRVNALKSTANTQGVKEFDKLLAAFENPDNVFSDAFNQGYQDAISDKGAGNGLSMADSYAQAQQEAQGLVSEIQTFISSLENVYTSALEILEKTEADFENELLESMSEGAGTVDWSSEAALSYITKILQSKDIIGVKSSEGASVSAVNKIAVLLNSLKVITESGGGTDSLYGIQTTVKEQNGNGKITIQNESDAVYTLKRKVAGSLRNVSGRVGEIATKAGFESALEASGLKKMLEDANKNIVGSGKGFEIKVDADAGIGQRKDKSTDTFHVAKSDVDIAISVNGVTLTLGASVKNYKTKGGALPNSIHVGTKLDFLTMYQKAVPSDSSYDALYNLAAGHAGKNRSKSYSVSETALTEKWRDTIKYVVAVNFVDVISGIVQNNGGAQTLVVAINGQIIPISKILISMDKSNVTYRLFTQENGSFSREAIAKENKWKRRYKGSKDVELAQERSAETWEKINKTLRNAKINITLSHLAELLK